MGFLADLLIRIGGDTSGLNTSLDQAGRSVKKFGADMASTGMALTAGVSLPLIGIGAAALKAAGDMEQTKIAFTTMLKSADAAAVHVEQLKKFALTTPFQFNDLAQASRLMQAYGFAAQDVVPKLRTIGNAVSALGGGRDVLERVVRSIGEIGTRGKITGEQLRELSRAGIPALDAVAKKLGVTVAEAQKKITAGAVDAKTATDGILEYMDRRFAGGMEAQSKTMLGSWSNIKDRLTFTMVDIGNSFLPIARNIITDTLDPMLQKIAALAQAFASLPKPVQSAGLSIAGLAATLPILTLAVGTFIEKALVIEKVLGMLGALALAPMFLGVAGGAIGAAVAFTELGERTKDLHSLDGKLIEQLDKWIEKHRDLRSATQSDLAAMTADAEKFKQTLSGMLDFGIIGMKEFADKMKALKEAQLRIDLAPTVQDMAKSGIQLRVVADTATDALERLGITSTAERRKALKEAQEAYAQLKAEGKESGVVLAEAAAKVKAAYEALVPALGKVKEGVSGAFRFGEKGLESGVLIEQVRQLAAERQKFVSDIVKAGGLDAFKGEAADNVKKAIEQLNNAPKPELMERMGEAIKDILDPTEKLPDDLQDVANALDAFGLSSNKANIPGLQRNFEILGAGLESGAVSVEQYTRAWIALVKAMDAAGEYVDPSARREVIELEKQYGGQIRETRKEQNEYVREMQRAFHSISRGIASSIVEWKGWGATFKNIAKDTAQSILAIMIEGLFKKLAKELADLLANTTGILGKIGKALGGLVSGGSSAAGSVAGGAAGAGGSVASGAGGAASAASSSVMGIIGVGAQVGTMISSIVGNVQFAGMNKSLDVLVSHSLRIFNVVFQGLNEHYLFKAQLFAKLDDMWRTHLNIYDLLGKGITSTGGKGGLTVNIYGGTFSGTPQQNAAAMFEYAEAAGVFG